MLPVIFAFCEEGREFSGKMHFITGASSSLKCRCFLKAVGNKKVGGSGRGQMIGFGLGL
jgi:hypothetical protein